MAHVPTTEQVPEPWSTCFALNEQVTLTHTGSNGSKRLCIMEVVDFDASSVDLELRWPNDADRSGWRTQVRIDGRATGSPDILGMHTFHISLQPELCLGAAETTEFTPPTSGKPRRLERELPQDQLVEFVRQRVEDPPTRRKTKPPQRPQGRLTPEYLMDLVMLCGAKEEALGRGWRKAAAEATGCSPSTLSKRLERAVELGLAVRPGGHKAPQLSTPGADLFADVAVDAMQLHSKSDRARVAVRRRHEVDHNLRRLEPSESSNSTWLSSEEFEALTAGNTEPTRKPTPEDEE